MAGQVRVIGVVVERGKAPRARAGRDGIGWRGGRVDPARNLRPPYPGQSVALIAADKVPFKQHRGVISSSTCGSETTPFRHGGEDSSHVLKNAKSPFCDDVGALGFGLTSGAGGADDRHSRRLRGPGTER